VRVRLFYSPSGIPLRYFFDTERDPWRILLFPLFYIFFFFFLIKSLFYISTLVLLTLSPTYALSIPKLRSSLHVISELIGIFFNNHKTLVGLKLTSFARTSHLNRNGFFMFYPDEKQTSCTAVKNRVEH
jgi:hypothetical protein